jgi:hypothetical protein
MPAVIVPRADVTAEQVSAVLREKLGPRYKVTPAATSHFHHQSPAGADSVLVRRHWFEQASIRIVPGDERTEIHIGNAANFTPTGLLINRASIIRKLHQVLEHAPELAAASPAA